MTTLENCPRCGGPIVAEALAGLCPRCLAGLIATGLDELPDSTQPLPPAPEIIAPHFPQLDILDCLGAGGMGVVYRALQKNLKRTVALKILYPQKAKQPGFAERFCQEAQALARLNHPNIVTVYDFGQTDEHFYLLMEYVDGVSLRQILQTEELPNELAMSIVPTLCDALQYAHERGIVHRDIKPENLLLDCDGRIKIADFGISRILDIAESDGQVVGTPPYMAPEQRDCPSGVDSRADVYALGVVLYELLTHEFPRTDLPLATGLQSVGQRMSEVVLHALARSPEDRFADATEFKTAFLAVTPPVEGAPRGGRPLRWAIAAAGLAAFLAAGLAAWWSQNRQPAAALSRPYGGSPRRIPGTVEMEFYDEDGPGKAWSDDNPDNRGGCFRKGGVDLGRTDDGGEGFYLGWTQPGEWVNYTVEIAAAGTYTMEARVSHGGRQGGTFHLECDGRDITGEITLPGTGHWHTWHTLRREGLQLPAGRHVLRLVFDSGGGLSSCGSINWLRFTLKEDKPDD